MVQHNLNNSAILLWYERLKSFSKIFIPALLLMYMLIQAYNGLWCGLYPDLYFNSSEFLINYEGGFVRRGLLGQILLSLCRGTGWSPIVIIYAFCITVFVLVFVFFIVQFQRKRLNWWILLSPFMFGLALEIIRKDYLTFMLFIMMLYCVRKPNISLSNYIWTLIMIVIGVVIYEPFIFYGIPLILLLLWRNCNNLFLSIAAVLVALTTFCLMSYFKGNADMVQTIMNSWDNMGPDNTPLLTSLHNAVGAIGWDTVTAIKYHLRSNFVSYGTNFYRYGIVFQSCSMIIVYYFIMNFTPLFSDKETSVQQRLIISSISMLSIICLLPMFLFLSCDYGRLYQYVFIISYAVLLIVPHNLILSLFSKRYLQFIRNLNYVLNRIVPPSKGLMVIIMLFFAVNPYTFDVAGSIRTSVIFTDFHLIDKLLILLQ